MELAFAGRLLAACAAIACVLACVQFVAARVAGRAWGGRRGLLHVIESAYLPNAASLHVVRVAQRYYVVGRSGGHIATLCEIPPDGVADRETAAPPRARDAFAAIAAVAHRLRRTSG